MDHEHVISDDVVSYFVSVDEMSPILEHKRRFSPSLISSPTSRSDSSSSANSVSSESFQAYHQSAPVSYIEVPVTLYSVESYMYMGFTEIVAQQIWERFISRPRDMPDTFLDFALAHVDLGPEPDVYLKDEDWSECLRKCGINETLRNAILLPEFEDIRYSHSAKYWATDAIEMNYETLRTINDRLKSEIYARYNTDQRRRPGYSFSSGGKFQPPSSTTSPQVKGKSKDLVPLQMKPSAPSIAIETKPASLCPPGFTTLWKAVTRKRCEGLINPATQELEVRVLSSRPPTDFSGTNALVYFTPQKIVADRYAKWTKQKVPHAEIAIVQVNVPHSFSEQKVDGKNFSYLLENSDDPDNEWRQIVWHSKGFVREPKALRHIRRYGLLIGHCTTGLKIEHLKNHRMVGDQHILKVNDSGTMVKAIQWVLQGDDAEVDFNEQCRGNAWIWSVGQLAIDN